MFNYPSFLGFSSQPLEPFGIFLMRFTELHSEVLTPHGIPHFASPIYSISIISFYNSKFFIHVLLEHSLISGLYSSSTDLHLSSLISHLSSLIANLSHSSLTISHNSHNSHISTPHLCTFQLV
jgi:hypothetical protein